MEPTPSEKPCGYEEQEARGAVEQLQRQAALLDRQPEQGSEGLVAGTGGATGGGHLDESAIGIKLKHRLRVGRTHLGKLGRREGERAGQGEHGGPAGWVSSG